MATPPTRDEQIRAGDLTFHWVQWGEHGDPVVCLHGLTANAFCFQALADELAHDYRVFAYDLRGRGDSAKPDHGYSVSLHAADLANLIDAWGLERPALLGHSLGAFIGLNFAARYPDRLSRLVLVDAGAPSRWKAPEELPLWLTTSIARLGQPVASFDEYVQRLRAAPFLNAHWNDYIQAYFEHDVRRLADGAVVSKASREAIIEEAARGAENDPAGQWAQVEAPTLLLRAGQGMFAEDDQLLREEDAVAVQRGIRRCLYVSFPMLNHYTIIFGVEPGPAEAIRSFLAETAAETGTREIT